MSVAETSSRSAAEVAPPLCALLRLKAASERPSATVPGSHATLLSAGKSDCNTVEQIVTMEQRHITARLEGGILLGLVQQSSGRGLQNQTAGFR